MMEINMLEWMITSSLLILAMLGVRALCGERVSLRLRYALWLVVAVRLLAPFSLTLSSVPVPVTATDLAPEVPKVLERPLSPDTAMGHANIPAEKLEASGFHVESDGTVTADGQSWYPVLDQETGGVRAYFGGWTLGDTLWAIWAGGAVLTALAFLAANLRFAHQMRQRRRPLKAEELGAPCLFGVTLPDIYVVEGLASPCLFGLFRPAIYLTPEVAEDGRVRSHVLAHELTHYAHWDHIWAVVRCLCLALHWYNPLVWLAAFLSKRDGELACDEGAVARLGEDQRIPYGRTLVDLVAEERRPADLLTCSTTMTEGKSSIRRRVEVLVKHPKTVKAVLFAVVAVVALAVVFTFARERQPLTYAEALDHLTRSNHVFTNHTDVNVGKINAVAYDHDYARSLAELLSGGTESEGEDDLDLYMDWLDMYSEGKSAFCSVAGPYKSYLLYLAEQPDGCYLAMMWMDSPENEPLQRLAILPTGTVQRVVELTENFAEGKSEGLTEEELTWFNEEFFNGEGFNLRNQFLSSTYKSPEEIDLYELFYLGGGVRPGASMSEEERQAVIDADYGGVEPDCACAKTTRAEMDRDLLEHTGLTLDQTNGNGLEKFTHLPEYDSYYVYHGDTNYRSQVTVTSGTRQGDTVTLYYDDDFMNRGTCAITLREVEEGRYQFVSHLPAEVEESASYQIHDPEYISAISQLLLSDPKTVALNGSEDYDMADWLTNWTNTYDIFYGVPWWDENAPEGWWARAIDAGSWYSVQIPDHMVEPVLALCREAQEAAQETAELMTLLSSLSAGDIQDFYGQYDRSGVDREELVRVIRATAQSPMDAPEDGTDYNRYSLWYLSLSLPQEDSLQLRAGLAEDVVEVVRGSGKNRAQGWFHSPELYRIIRGYWTPAPEDIVQADLAPIREDVDQILAAELARENQKGENAPYTGAELTEFRLLSSYPDLVKGAEVNFYAFDYGLTLEDLDDAFWAGGMYADGEGRVHPYSFDLHLLTVERDGRVEGWRTVPWEYRLEEGQPDFWDTVDRQEVLDVVLSNLEDLLDPVVPASVTDPQQVAEEYGKALAQYYLSLGSGHPNAVIYAQLAEVEVYQQAEDGLCAFITLAVDPVEPNSVRWAAGAGIEQGEDGHWLDTLQYQLVLQEDGTWRCMNRGTGGVTLPEFSWSASQDLEPDMARSMEWNTDLRAVVTRLSYGNTETAMGVSGETGALDELAVTSTCVWFTPYFAAALTDTYVWGEALDALSQAGASQNQDEQPDPSPEARAAVAQWLRVTKDGEEIPGTLWWVHGNGFAQFQFDFDEPLSMKPGDQVVVEIGPRD